MRDIWLVNHRIELLGQDSWWWDRKQTRNSLHRIAIMYCGGDTKQWGWQSSHLPHNSDLEQLWFMNLGLATFQQEKTSQSDPITTIILNQLRWRLWSKLSRHTTTPVLHLNLEKCWWSEEKICRKNFQLYHTIWACKNHSELLTFSLS